VRDALLDRDTKMQCDLAALVSILRKRPEPRAALANLGCLSFSRPVTTLHLLEQGAVLRLADCDQFLLSNDQGTRWLRRYLARNPQAYAQQDTLLNLPRMPEGETFFGALLARDAQQALELLEEGVSVDLTLPLPCLSVMCCPTAVELVGDLLHAFMPADAVKHRCSYLHDVLRRLQRPVGHQRETLWRIAEIILLKAPHQLAVRDSEGVTPLELLRTLVLETPLQIVRDMCASRGYLPPVIETDSEVWNRLEAQLQEWPDDVAQSFVLQFLRRAVIETPHVLWADCGIVDGVA
jgi:hypothetical protein